METTNGTVDYQARIENIKLRHEIDLKEKIKAETARLKSEFNAKKEVEVLAVKKKYEEALAEKDTEIQELKSKLSDISGRLDKANSTIDRLNRKLQS